MSWRWFGVFAFVGLGSCFAASSPADAGDFWRPTPDFLAPSPSEYMYEARGGLYRHSVGGWEAGSFDLNGEFLFPKLPANWLPVQYQFFVPRPHIGAMLNTAGKTSYAYIGMVWTLNITPRLFLEPIFGGAFHNGKLEAPPDDPNWNSLGCRALFHTGMSVGYRVT